MAQKIAFFSPGSLLNYGGGDKWIINMGNILIDRGYDVSVYTSSMISPNGPRLNVESLSEITKFSYTELLYKKSKFKPMKLKQIPNDSFEFIYVMGGYYGILKQLLHIKGIKTYGFHDPALQNPKNALQKRILSKIIPEFDKVHMLSEEQIKIVENKNKFLLENTWLFDPIPQEEKFDKFTVLFFGRHENIKGISTVKYVAENLPESINMIITGTGESSNILNNINRKNVKNLGFIDEKELSSLISKSHIILFPSYVEASSLVPVEAFAHHTPVIYRPIPQNRLLMKSEFNISASEDLEFLQAILLAEKNYSEESELYLKYCFNLSELLTPRDEYLKLFIKYFFQ